MSFFTVTFPSEKLLSEYFKKNPATKNLVVIQNSIDHEIIVKIFAEKSVPQQFLKLQVGQVIYKLNRFHKLSNDELNRIVDVLTQALISSKSHTDILQDATNAGFALKEINKNSFGDLDFEFVSNAKKTNIPFSLGSLDLKFVAPVKPNNFYISYPSSSSPKKSLEEDTKIKKEARSTENDDVYSESYFKALDALKGGPMEELD